MANYGIPCDNGPKVHGHRLQHRRDECDQRAARRRARFDTMPATTSGGAPTPPSHHPRKTTPSARPARQSKRELAREALKEGGYDLVATIILEPDSWFDQVADTIIDALPEDHRENAGHWLCTLLLDAAKILNPATYAGFIADGVRDQLISEGVSGPVAGVAAATIKLALTTAVAHASGLGCAPLAMKALIPATCPDLNTCPAKKELFKTFEVPFVIDQLKALAGM